MKFFEFTFEELDIRIEEIEILMGFEPHQAPHPFSEWIKDELSEASSLCNLKGGFEIFNDITVDTQNETIKIKDQLFSPGRIVVSQLKNATSAGVFVCTAGHNISDFAKTKGKKDNEFMYYIMDVIGSVTVEKVADKIQEKIESEANKKGLKITSSFSPGYCDWSVTEQHKLFALLPQYLFGITLSDSSLMNPLKSISGITGIGKDCDKQGYQCNWCYDSNCIYGKIRRRKI